jgi:nitrogen fixation-related uncharacterized protein
MSPDATFAVIWVTFTVLVWVAVIPFAYWAVKTGQFKSQERARHLALRSGPPVSEKSENHRKGNRDHVSS